MSEFYSYLWLSPDGTPYYVGKGTGNRAFDQHRRRTFCSVLRPTDLKRIVVFPHNSEAEALASERAMIAFYGRQTLFNRNDGGRRGSDLHSAETKVKIGQANTRAMLMRRRIEKAAQGRYYASLRWGNANV